MLLQEFQLQTSLIDTKAPSPTTSARKNYTSVRRFSKQVITIRLRLPDAWPNLRVHHPPPPSICPKLLVAYEKSCSIF